MEMWLAVWWPGVDRHIQVLGSTPSPPAFPSTGGQTTGRRCCVLRPCMTGTTHSQLDLCLAVKQGYPLDGHRRPIRPL